MVQKGKGGRKASPITKESPDFTRLRRRLKTPKGRVGEALRLAVSYKRLQHELAEMLHSLGSEWDSDEALAVKLDEAEVLLQRTVGRTVMYGGLSFEKQMEAGDKGGASAV